MPCQRVTKELHVGIDDGGPQRLHTFEPLALDGVAHGVGMNVQFAFNGANLPMFGVKITANRRAGFRRDHALASPSSWHPWKRVDEAPRPATDPASQPQNGLPRRVLLRLGWSTLEECRGCDRKGTLSVLSAKADRPELYFHCRSTLSLIVGALDGWSSKPRGEHPVACGRRGGVWGSGRGTYPFYDLPDEVFQDAIGRPR